MPGAARYIHGTAASEQERLRRLNLLTNPPFLEFLPLRPGQRVLELGSGLGILAAEVAERVGPGFVTGLELSPDQLCHAPRAGRGLAFIRGDVHRPPLRDGSLDLVYCRFLLEHVREPVEVLRAARRVLRPGGRICIQENTILVNQFDPDCPAFDYVWSRFVELQRRLGGDAMIGKQLFRLLADAGFSDIELSIAPEVHRAGQSTYQGWIDNLAGNIRSAEAALVDHSLVPRSDIDRAYRELDALAANPTGSAWFYWNRAAARRTPD